MKIRDRAFIREIVSSDFKHISNPDFTRDTLERIAELEDNKVSYSNSGDITFLIPVIIYFSFIILLSLFSSLISWIPLEHVDTIMHSIEIISNYLLHPVTFSILFSFSLLYLLDLYLKKVSVKSASANSSFST